MYNFIIISDRIRARTIKMDGTVKVEIDLYPNGQFKFQTKFLEIGTLCIFFILSHPFQSKFDIISKQTVCSLVYILLINPKLDEAVATGDSLMLFETSVLGKIEQVRI